MCTNDQTRRPAFVLITLLAVVLTGMYAHRADAQQTAGAGDFQWLDVAGKALPFQDDAGIRSALRSAKVFSRERLDRPGLEDYQTLVLELDELRFYALFRAGAEAAKLEVAAYEIDQLLGIGMVPPVIERTIGDDAGAVQIWRQRAGTEIEIDRAGMLVPPDAGAFAQQKQGMYLFDNLIANPKRSQENIVIDPGWKIWLIDHASAFEPTTELLCQLELTKCERGLWQRLRELDKATLEARMTPYLDKKQISKLVARHRKLVKHIQQMISTFGEGVVLFGSEA